MIQNVAKTIRVEKVYPGPYGGAIIVGVPAGENEEVRCKVSSRIVTRLPCCGEFWLVEGTMVSTQRYGMQLIASSCRPTDVPSPSYVSSLLVKHPVFRGFALGPKKVGDLLREFGDEVLVGILDIGNIDALTGAIALPVAVGLVNAWQTLRNENAAISFFIDHKFSPELARKVLSLCHDGTVERLMSNPYALVCFGGVTRNIWQTMEKCSEKLGFSPDFHGRLVGGIEHVLYEHLRVGNTAIGKAALLSKAEELLGAGKRAEEGLRLSLERKAVCVYPQQPEPLFQLVGIGIIEQTLERRIDALVAAPLQLSLFGSGEIRIKSLVDSYDNRARAAGGPGMNLEQKNAVVMALTTRCSVITGYGGTGKTTVLKVIADIAGILDRKVYMLALTGKAKERLRQATGYKSFTIHAFIGAVKKGTDELCLDNNPLIIIDECSMVDTALFNTLLELFEGRTYSLLTVGDTDQISPVGFGLVWHRMADLNFIPRTNLTQVYRQRSSLNDIAMKVRSKDQEVLKSVADAIPEWNGEAEGVYFVLAVASTLRHTLFNLKSSVDGILRERLRTQIQRTLEKENSSLPHLLQVAVEAKLKAADDAGEIPKAIILTPHMSRRMLDSGDKINRHLQACLTPRAHSIQLGDRKLRVGDPVVVMDNSYALGLFNGMTGILLAVSARHGQTTGHFQFDGKKEPVCLSLDEMLDVGIQVGYAISIHKSQGSEYEAVLMTCVQSSPMLDRSLIYTALTRSKRLCLIVGSREVFKTAVTKPSRAESLQVGFYLGQLNQMVHKAGIGG
ncbi:AAA family ATPase [Geomonas edaphica]|uniref:AAA family ATPase n=1 Tax=Geomonas edaphica TaxID=2570226 RepID=UPI0013A5CD47|nr:AAA family ATPase [Geomonas edaphica]